MLRRPTLQSYNLAIKYTPCLLKTPPLYKSSVVTDVEKPPNVIVNFRNAKVAYAGSTTFELIRACFIYRICSHGFLVKNSKKLMEFGSKILGNTLFKKIMELSFYGQFVAGEDQDKIQPIVTRYREFGVKSILDYSIERDISESETVQKIENDASGEVRVPDRPSNASTKQYQPCLDFSESEAQCDQNMEIFMGCVDAASRGISHEGFVAIKMTALGRPQFMLKLSDVLVQMERIFDVLIQSDTMERKIPSVLRRIDLDYFQKRLEQMGLEISVDKSKQWFTLLDKEGDGAIDLHEWLNFTHFEHDLTSILGIKSKQTGKMEPLVSTLTLQEVHEMQSMIQRIDNLTRYARSKGVRLMVDAEHSYFQPAIRRLAMEMMRRFNKENTVVFTTCQCYLKNALHELSQDLEIAEAQQFNFGAKLVRGAYMDLERARAQKLGYPDPVNPNFEATTKMYKACLEKSFSAMERRPHGGVSIIVASHNEETVRFALERMNEHGIRPEDELVCFAQLFGMCDHISFPLANAGYPVYKYVPYGLVSDVLPYLSRRVNENQSILSNVKVERAMRWTELRRRLTSGNLFIERPSVTA